MSSSDFGGAFQNDRAVLRKKFVGVTAALSVVCLLGIAFMVPVFAAGPAAAETYQLIVGAAQEPDSLNVFAMTLSMSYTINFLVYDTLTNVMPDFSPGPLLAGSWETSPDGLVWTFHLVENALWHDGQQVTADDVAFTYNLILDNPREGALWIDYLSDVTSVIATDTYTLEVTTAFPKATMLTIMVPILPEHIWSLIDPTDIDKVDPWDPTAFPTGPVGSGPLKLLEWDMISGEILLEKNPNYYIDVVKADTVLFKTYGDEAVMVSALWAGSIDVAMDVPARLWDETLAKDGIDGQATGALSFYELGINCASAEWRTAFPRASTNLETTNLSVRQAIAMATNKTDIVDRIMQGLADPGESIIPTATPFWHYYVPDEERWDYHLDEARALLDAAGYVDGSDSDTFRENSTSGAELDFTLYYRKGYTDEEGCAYAIRDSLAQIGIGAELHEVSEGVLWQTWMNCEYDLFIWGWDTDVDPNFMLSTMTAAQYPVDPQDSTKWGDAFWVNEEYEAMYVEQQRAVNLTERQSIVHEMQRMLYYHCPYVVLYYPMGLHAYDTDNWAGYPNMVDSPGTTPGTMWFFFAVTPIALWEEEYPPEDVDAGPDQSCVVGEELSFSGDAFDPDTLMSELNWTWSFTEPAPVGTTYVRYGQDVSYTFNNVGDVTATLVVRDPDLQTGSDSLVVTVSEMSATAGWLKGTVKDQFLSPVVGATVNASGELRTTDLQGEYSVALEEGAYSVLVSKTGYANASGDCSVVADEITWANFTLPLTSGTLEGHVYDAGTGLAVKSAAVKISGGEMPTFMTNDEGFFQFTLVPAGNVTVTVTKSGYEDNVSYVDVVAGETATHDIDLTALEEDEGSNTLAIAAVAGIVVVAVAAGAIYMLRKKKTDVPPPPPEN